MQVHNYIDFNGKKLLIKRAIREEKLKPGYDQSEMKEWTKSDILLRKDGILYCCETIEDAEIISEE